MLKRAESQVGKLQFPLILIFIQFILCLAFGIFWFCRWCVWSPIVRILSPNYHNIDQFLTKQLIILILWHWVWVWIATGYTFCVSAFFSLGPMHYSQDLQVLNLTKSTLKLSPTALFTHLKIILLQCFQFSIFSNKRYSNRLWMSSVWWNWEKLGYTNLSCKSGDFSLWKASLGMAYHIL